MKALGADEVLVEELVEAVGQEHAAAVLGEGGYLLAQRIRICGGHYAFVGIEDVVALEGVVLRDIHCLGLEAEQQGLAEARIGVLPVSGTRAAVVEHGGVQIVFVRVDGAQRYLGRGQLVLLDFVVVPAADERYAYLTAARAQPDKQGAADDD